MALWGIRSRAGYFTYPAAGGRAGPAPFHRINGASWPVTSFTVFWHQTSKRSVGPGPISSMMSGVLLVGFPTLLSIAHIFISSDG